MLKENSALIKCILKKFNKEHTIVNYSKLIYMNYNEIFL